MRWDFTYYNQGFINPGVEASHGAVAASYSPRRSRRSNMQCPRSTGPGTHLVTDRQGQVARPVIDSGDTRLVAADVVK
jgi:hypothetical protein